MIMDFKENQISDVVEILGNSADTIVFDEEINLFRIAYANGAEVAITPDRLIDIL